MKMPNQKQKHTKRNVVLSIVVLVVILGGYITYAAINDTWPFSDATTPSVETTNSSDSENNKPGNTNSDSTDPTNKAPKQYEGENKYKNDSSLSGIINYKNVSNGTLSIRTTIDQKISEGTCTLTLKKSGTDTTVTRTANIIANPSSSTCNGFDIATSDMSAGTWSITIDLTSGGKHGTMTGDVTI